MTRGGVISATAATLNGWVRRNSKNVAMGDDRPLLHTDVPRTSSVPFPRSYGGHEVSPLSQSPERMRTESLLRRVPEEELEENDSVITEEEQDWELEQEGLYRGSYRRIVLLYSFVPLATLLAFVFLTYIPALALPIPTPHAPHPMYFPSPLPEGLTAAGLWSLAHLLRQPTHAVFSLLPSVSLATTLSTATHVLLHNILRLATLPLLGIRRRMLHPQPTWRDWAFRRVWWIALGWCLAESVVGVAQGYEQISLYRDVLVPEEDLHQILQDHSGTYAAAADRNGKRSSSVEDEIEQSYFGATPSQRTNAFKRARPSANAAECSGTTDAPAANVAATPLSEPFRPLTENAVRLQIDRDLEYLIALNEREQLEQVYGVPFIRIPVFVSCLQRISSIVLSIGLMLLSSSAYLGSPISRGVDEHEHGSIDSNSSFWITFCAVLALHAFLSMLHTPMVLPHIGVHTAAYVGLLVGLGCLFAGLGMWEVLS